MTNSIVPHSDSNKQPSVFYFEGKPLYADLDDSGAPRFVASDVCEILDLENVAQAVSRLDPDEKGITTVYTHGGSQDVLTVNQSGLFHLIFTSRKKEAKRFRKWVTAEVLPALFETGSYSLQPMTPGEMFLAQAQQFIKVERQMAELQRLQSEQAMQIESITDRLNDADYYTVRAFCIKQRIDFTQSLLIKWGKEATALSRHREIERKETIENDRPTGRYHKSILFDVCKPKPANNNQPYLLPKGE